MNDFFRYLLEFNIAFTVLYLSYRVFFNKDRNFKTRRSFLLLMIGGGLMLPLIPLSFNTASLNANMPSFTLPGVSIYGDYEGTSAVPHFNIVSVLQIIYFTVLLLGFAKLGASIIRILIAAGKSEKIDMNGHIVLSSRILHASSFFNFIFIDLINNRKDSVNHILDHEVVHCNEKHSFDRILAETLVILCWFNPFAWLYRRSVIENHEFLADSAVVTGGTNIITYQISILNQYIESASITNQFSSHIKKRIKMLNTSYKIGSRWKVAMLLPAMALALFINSCGDQKEQIVTNQPEESLLQDEGDVILPTEEVFYVVEEMPTFHGEDPGTFRKYIAQNIIYPKEAAENGVSGKIFIKFIVSSEGKVVIPDNALLAAAEGKSIDEVVVVAYRSLKEGASEPDEKYIELLKQEAIRVVSSSPDWEPGKQRGTAVNVMFTFPIVFALQ